MIEALRAPIEEPHDHLHLKQIHALAKSQRTSPCVVDDLCAGIEPISAGARSKLTLKNLVGVVEALGSAVFHGAVTDAEQRLNGKGNIFQRLDHTADLFVAAGYPDLRAVLDADRWQRLIEFWAMRHVFTHNDGLVDARFLTKVPTSTARIGQRLAFTEQQCRQAITDTEALCHTLGDLTTP